jgi:hypothetical protein
MPRELAIVLCSGSIQSAVVSALAAQKHRTVMLFCETTANPGRSGQAFDAMVQHFKPYRSHRIAMPWMAGVARPESRGAEADPRSSEATTGRLLDLMPLVACGLRFAAHYNAVSLMLGIRVGSEGQELARVAEHGQIWAEMVQMTCDRPALEVEMPLLDLEPWQVVDLGLQVSAPLQLAWSCESLIGEACGQCRGCKGREQAFVRSGRPDPLKIPSKVAG